MFNTKCRKNIIVVDTPSPFNQLLSPATQGIQNYHKLDKATDDIVKLEKDLHAIYNWAAEDSMY